MQISLVVFTHNLCFRDWDNAGFSERELFFYRKLSTISNIKVSFVQYSHTKYYLDGINSDFVVHSICPLRPFSVFSFLRSLLKILSSINADTDSIILLKTNQLKSILPCLFAKILYKKPIILRLG